MLAGRYLTAGLIGMLLLIMLHGVYRHYSYLGDRVLRKLLAGVTLLLAAATIGMHSLEQTWWLYMLRTALIYAGLLLAYLAAEELLSGKAPPPLWRHAHGRAALFCAASTLILLYLRRDKLASFVDNEQFTAHWMYYALGFLYHLFLLCVALAFVRLYWRSLAWYASATSLASRLIFLLAFVLAALLASSVELNLLLTLVEGDTYRAALNQVYHVSKVLVFALLVLGLLLPRLLPRRAVRMLEQLLQRQQAGRERLLRYLHERMIRVVPGVQLHSSQLREARLLIEISDARQIVWSHHGEAAAYGARDEAELLVRLLANKIVIEEPGPHLPAPAGQRNVLKYNLSVARRLERLERARTIALAGQAPRAG